MDATPFRGKQNDAQQRHAEVNRPQPVNLMLAAFIAAVEYRADHQQREQAERQIDIEDPAPGGVLHQKTADQRADHRREAKNAAEQPLIATTIGGWDDVGDRRHADHHQAAAAEPLQAAHQHQLGHVLRQPAEGGADEKQPNRHLQHDFATEQIAEFTVQRHRDGGAEDIGGDHPGKLVQPAQFADNRRQRGGDNGLIQRREQHHQQQCAEQQAYRLHRWVSDFRSHYNARLKLIKCIINI